MLCVCVVVCELCGFVCVWLRADVVRMCACNVSACACLYLRVCLIVYFVQCECICISVFKCVCDCVMCVCASVLESISVLCVCVCQYVRCRLCGEIFFFACVSEQANAGERACGRLFVCETCMHCACKWMSERACHVYWICVCSARKSEKADAWKFLLLQSCFYVEIPILGLNKVCQRIESHSSIHAQPALIPPNASWSWRVSGNRVSRHIHWRIFGSRVFRHTHDFVTPKGVNEIL